MNEQRRPQAASGTQTDPRSDGRSQNSESAAGTRPAPGAGDSQDSRSISEMFSGAVTNLQNIVRSEVQLAKTEMREEAKLAGKAAAMLAVAAVVGAYALGLFLLTAVWALATQMDQWLAALIVAAVVTVIAGVLAMVGKSRLDKFSPKPDQTIDSVKEDIEWVKQQTP